MGDSRTVQWSASILQSLTLLGMNVAKLGLDSADAVIIGLSSADNHVCQSILYFLLSLFPQKPSSKAANSNALTSFSMMKPLPWPINGRETKQAFKEGVTARLAMLESQGVIPRGTFRRSLLTQTSNSKSNPKYFFLKERFLVEVI